MKNNRTKYSIKEMAAMLGVTEQGYYKWLNRGESVYKHETLLAMINSVLTEDDENMANYGVLRIYLRLRQDDFGYTGSYSTVYRVMKDNGLTQKVKRHPNGLTKEDKEAQKAENIIKQDFTAERPGEKLLTDITEIPTKDGKLYISPVLDCFDGAIVGLAMDDNMRKELCVNALEQAVNRYGYRNMIVHSDRGSQYTSHAFKSTILKYGGRQSMSGTGKCYDNARMESFFAMLKKEKLYKIKTQLLPMETVKSIIFCWIETYYNRKRVYTEESIQLIPVDTLRWFTGRDACICLDRLLEVRIRDVG